MFEESFVVKEWPETVLGGAFCHFRMISANIMLLSDSEFHKYYHAFTKRWYTQTAHMHMKNTFHGEAHMGKKWNLLFQKQNISSKTHNSSQ